MSRVMTLQTKSVLYYFIIAFSCILFHYSASAQHVIPDANLKTNVSSLTNSLDYINALQPKRFEYNTASFSHLKLPNGKFYGFLTEEFQQVFPAMVTRRPIIFASGKNASQTAIIQDIDQEKLVPILVAAIKEQQAQIKELQDELAQLREQMKQQ